MRCVGVLYRPVEARGDVPCVVLAHGFSGTMDWIVPDFASVFAGGGLAALMFDYRYLGASGGQPRQPRPREPTTTTTISASLERSTSVWMGP